jgi:hypothetical protein
LIVAPVEEIYCFYGCQLVVYIFDVLWSYVNIEKVIGANDPSGFKRLLVEVIFKKLSIM